MNVATRSAPRIMRIGMPLLFIIMIIQNQADITIIPIGKIVP
jgi:hypothetical protein